MGSLKPSEISFDTLCDFFQVMENRQFPAAKCIEGFIATCVDKESKQAFDIFRLILPQLDLERGNYHLLEKKLVNIILDAAGIDRKSPIADAAGKWKLVKDEAEPSTISGVPRFGKTLKRLVFNDQCDIKDDAPSEEKKRIKIGDVNEKLDALAAAGNDSATQAGIIRWFLKRATPLQMRWICDIILKNVKIGASETTIFKAWHPDAQDVYNNCGMSLRKVFNEMTDRSKPEISVIKPGYPVRPQLAIQTMSTQKAFQRMHRSEQEGGGLIPFVIETKLDGERIQVHRCNGVISYYSRNAIEHGERSGYNILDPAITAATSNNDDLILDGELVAWDTAKSAFIEFGTLKSIVASSGKGVKGDDRLKIEGYKSLGYNNEGVAAANGDDDSSPSLPPKFKDIELWYVAFDILYAHKCPTIDRILDARYQMIKEVLHERSAVPVPDSPLHVRVVPMLPNHTMFGEVMASKKGSSEEDIACALDEVIKLHEEGIVIKSLESRWVSDDRSTTAWLKIKPDYIHTCDLDCVILGGWYGSGRRAHMLSMFLLGLRTAAPPNEPNGGSSGLGSGLSSGPPLSSSFSGFMTFCKVGTGYDDEELKQINENLKNGSLLVESLDTDGTYVDHTPACVVATGREKPDFWVKNPWSAPVLNINADIRAIKSSKFAAPYSLRFPRVACVSEKTASLASTGEELENMVQQGREEKWGGGPGHPLVMDTRQGDDHVIATAGKYGIPRKRRVRGREEEEAVKAAPIKRPRAGQVAPAFDFATDLSSIKAESSALKNCVVYFASQKGDMVLPPAPTPAPTSCASSRNQSTKGGLLSKADAQALTKKLGGDVNALYAKNVTHIIAGIGNNDAPYVKQHAARGRDVISAGWLMRCAEQHALVPLLPKDYLAMSDETRGQMRRIHLTVALDAEDVGSLMRSMRTDDVDVDRVVETLKVKVKAAAGSEEPLHANDRPTRELVVPLVDSLLAMHGCLDWKRSVLHGHSLVFVSVGVTSDSVQTPVTCPSGCSLLLREAQHAQHAVSNASRALLAIEKRRIILEARVHGALVKDRMDRTVTHLVVIAHPQSPSLHSPTSVFLQKLVSPRALLAAVSEQAGGSEGVAALETRLLSKKVLLVSTEWLDGCYRAAEDLDDDREVSFPSVCTGVKARIPEPDDHPVLVDADCPPTLWPWREFSPIINSPATYVAGVKTETGMRRIPRRRGKTTLVKPVSGQPPVSTILPPQPHFESNLGINKDEIHQKEDGMVHSTAPASSLKDQPSSVLEPVAIQSVGAPETSSSAAAARHSLETPSLGVCEDDGSSILSSFVASEEEGRKKVPDNTVLAECAGPSQPAQAPGASGPSKMSIREKMKLALNRK